MQTPVPAPVPAPAPAEASARPARRDAQRNQELVVAAARAVISEFGTEASVELVAARAGVGVGTVYRHFANKQALVDELVRIILDELITAARTALARGDGTGLESYLRVLGQSCADHRGYADQLVGHTRTDCATVLHGLTGDLLEQAQQHGQIGSWVTVGDVRATTWALRGIIGTAGPVAPGAWQRHLDIQLAGLRAGALPGAQPALTSQQLERITGEPRTVATAPRRATP